MTLPPADLARIATIAAAQSCILARNRQDRTCPALFCIAIRP